MLAALRPHDIDFAVLVHVVGAMVLVGGLVTSAGAGVLAWRDEGPALRRFSYLMLLAVVLPGWIVMRVGAEWAYSKEHWDQVPSDPTWLGIGYMTADIGGLLLLIALILGGIGLRRGGGGGLLRAATVLSVVLLAAYVVAVWAMGGKPA